MILVTGGAGFIGGNFVLDWLKEPSAEGILNIDKLTYAGNLATLDSVKSDPRHVFVRGDIGDQVLVTKLLNEHQPRAIVNFAAESHVDRSIDDPTEFVKTNIVGTFNLLECSREYWNGLQDDQKKNFRFHHISTDEVYGSLLPTAPAFTETHPYKPNNPYSASKAASDHLVRAWFHTHGFPVVTTHCSNSYGPSHFPEKLIPLVIMNALNGKPLPIYGDGKHVRDWLYVGDHCAAIRALLAKGRLGETYNIGGGNEIANIDVVNTICQILDELKPRPDRKSYSDQKIFVKDRLGHDRRYAIDASKIQHELGWHPLESFDTGIRKTVQWYLDNPAWVETVASRTEHDWLQDQYS